jgi:hypothetical protein
VRTFALITASALCLAAPAPAQEPPTAPADSAGGLVLAATLGGGVEAGLDSGSAGLFEVELLAGWALPATASAGLIIRPELGVALGLAPDTHAALRPGVRLTIPETPLWLRAAFDWSNARGEDPRWRWLLVGVAWETRLTALLGLNVEADTGIPLSSGAGLPLLVRAGATFRL